MIIYIYSREIMVKIKTFLKKKEQLWEQAIHFDAIVGNVLINFKIGYHVSSNLPNASSDGER